jgi:nitrate/TMAO reductase-like tetraheme cytochrome c subunit
MSRLKKILVLAVVVVPLGFAVSMLATGTPGFCNSCHIMNPYYDNWKASAHTGINCLACHLKPGFVNYMKGKMVAPAHLVNYALGRIPSKPNAHVEDVSCLRSHCHDSEELMAKKITNNGLKFTHKGHISQVMYGIDVSCGVCHSHFEGDEHFEVNTQVCYICHFTKDDDDGAANSKAGCRDCHEEPDKVIKRGLVEVNHQEFATYVADCEGSCHSKQEHSQGVHDSVCLSCHSFRNENEVNSLELHAIHTAGEKVECFACHGEIEHGFSEEAPVMAMMDCGGCHSETHEVQRSIYTAQSHPLNKQADRVLNPMFVTHVECTGCHVGQTAKQSAGLGHFGTVAKAKPEACDDCHAEGTGERYIPFWQEQVRGLYEQVSRKAQGLEEQARFQADQQAAERLHAKLRQARTILETISNDGSWGVHNFKYTEAMLRKARVILDE